MAINKIDRRDVDTFKGMVEGHIDPGNCNLLDQYQKIAGMSAIYPGIGTPLGLVYVSLKGAGEAGEFAEQVGKAMRDDDFCDVELDVHGGVTWPTKLTPERRDALIKEAGDQLWYVQAKCRELGITLSQCALINLEKLCDRGERGKLQGSGDNR